MTSWRPQTEFEQEIVSLQPDYNFIYGDLTDTQRKLKNDYQPRPPAHLDYMKAKKEANSKTGNDVLPSNGLHALRTIHKMVGTKPLGTSTNFDDLDDTENLDRETVAMIRHCGMGPTVDMSLDERTTIQTLPGPKDVHIVYKGRKKFPVIFDDMFFKITSTRMRTARLMENVNSIANSIKGIEIVEKKPELAVLTVLNEEDVKEPTEAEKAATEYQDFITAYPLLGSDKKRKSTNCKTAKKSCQKNLKANFLPSKTDKKDIFDNGKSNQGSKSPIYSSQRNSWGSSSPQSSNGSSNYSDCNSFRSSSSTYETAPESLSWRRKSSSPNNTSGFPKLQQNKQESAYKNANESLSWRCGNSSKKKTSSFVNNQHPQRSQAEQKRYYSPMEVYHRKRDLYD